MKKLSLFGVVLLGLILMGGSVYAVTDGASLTVSATVNSKAKLTLGAASISFVDADPDTTPSITASPNPLTVTANIRTSSSSKGTLFCTAGGDLTSTPDAIAITNVTWTVSSGPLATGTLNSSTAQKVDDNNWTGSGTRSGGLIFHLANSWSYATGSYSASVSYTLTAP